MRGAHEQLLLLLGPCTLSFLSGIILSWEGVGPSIVSAMVVLILHLKILELYFESSERVMYF